MSRAARRQVWFVVVFLIVVVFFVTTYRMGVVHGQSMEPTYQQGQLVLVRRRNWFSAPLHHNDVVVVRKDRDVIIKRVYRLPGEEIDDTFPYVRRFTLVNHLSDYYEQKPSAIPGDPPRMFVPDGFIVVLGDNLRISEDSRIFGPVPLHDVLGTVVNPPPPPYVPAPTLPPPSTATPPGRPARP